jgi:hypothetical protein
MLFENKETHELMILMIVTVVQIEIEKKKMGTTIAKDRDEKNANFF